MKCLTVRQPWAAAIMAGRKPVENRTWRTHYRGPLLIHAGKRRSWAGEAFPDGTRVPAQQVFGALLGIIDLVDCVRVEECRDNPWASGPWCWVVENPRPFAEPIPYRGRQLLFDVPDDTPGLVNAPPRGNG
jgi:hypothetical protein